MSDLISREAVLESLKTDYSLIMFDSYGNLTFAGERIIEAIKGVPSVEPCADCVSREAVKKLLNEGWLRGIYPSSGNIDALPSVTPERPRGKWIRTIDPDVNAWTGGHICSECGRACVQMSMNYCANCGADMREVHDDD